MNTDSNLVLVVEDDPTTRKMLQRCLHSAEFQVLEAEDGKEALELYRQCRPKVLVLDILLPGLDGFEVCRILRDQGEAVGILMLTCKDSEADRIRGLDLGADDYMVKPFNPGELIARLRAILRRIAGSPTVGERLEHRGIRIEFRPQKCFKGGRELDLTPKNFLLLAELFKNIGRPLSRQQLSSLIWSGHRPGRPGNLDVHIRRLRERVEDNPGDPEVIRTVRGFGYVCE